MNISEFHSSQGMDKKVHSLFSRVRLPILSMYDDDKSINLNLEEKVALELSVLTCINYLDYSCCVGLDIYHFYHDEYRKSIPVSIKAQS